MKTVTTTKNYSIATKPEVLENIHQGAINIVIYNREINFLNDEINNLLKQAIELRLSGTIDVILNAINKVIDPHKFQAINKDIKELLNHFEAITKAQSFRLLLATINDNMCRKFHTDVNDLRLLCTYSGPGTLWLTEENINRRSLNANSDNECIVINENNIRQAATGSVVILKGALYPQEESNPVVHCSPTIEASGEKRLLLRIDTNEFLNF